MNLNDISSTYRTQAWSHLPCTPLSTMHDLTCGHRVQTKPGPQQQQQQCGSNCTHPIHPSSTPFICRLCIAQPILEGLGLASPDEALDPTAHAAELACPIVGALVEEERVPLLNSGCRDAAPLSRTDGLVQFVREFGTEVLGIGEREVLVLEGLFRGLQIKTTEEKGEAMRSVFAALGLNDGDGDGRGGVEDEEEEGAMCLC